MCNGAADQNSCPFIVPPEECHLFWCSTEVTRDPRHPHSMPDAKLQIRVPPPAPRPHVSAAVTAAAVGLTGSSSRRSRARVSLAARAERPGTFAQGSPRYGFFG